MSCGEIRRDQLIDAFGLRQILEPMRAQIAQAASRRQLALDQLGACTREQHLAAVADREQARDAVDRRAEVVAVALVGRTGMNGRAYAQSVDCRKILCGKSALGIEYRRNGVFGTREGRAERIAHRFENVAIVSGRSPFASARRVGARHPASPRGRVPSVRCCLRYR